MGISKWKGGLVGLAAAGLIASAAPAAHAACGDANNNGNVDAGDATLLLQYVAGLNAGTTFCGGAGAADANCLDLNHDGSADVADLVLLLNRVAGNPTLFFCSGAPTPLACGSTVHAGTIGSNVTLPADCDTFVDGTVLVAPGVVVTVQPGATVKGRKTSTDGTPSVLVFLPGARINAAGTPAKPIIFTSDQAPGSRGIGDWGGIVLNGRAPVNCPGGECVAEGLTGITFGGNAPNDSSGILTYARLEFSGIELSPDNELNILSQNGVGRGTTINHVEANWGFDDDFEWFGGTVNEKYLVAAAPGDDGLDWQLGFTGSVQFAIVAQSSGNSDNNGRHGIEADNNESGFDFLPRSNPAFCNITLLGTNAQPAGIGSGPSGRRGMLLRRGTGGRLRNMLIGDFTEAGLQLADNATGNQACANSTTLGTGLTIDHTTFFGNGPGGAVQANGNAGGNCAGNGGLTGPQNWFNLNGAAGNVTPAAYNQTNAAPAGLSSNPYPTSNTTLQYIPNAGSSADGTGTSCVPLDPTWFDATSWQGAFKPGATADAEDFNGNWLHSAFVGFETN
jgi:hypothetical protein